MAIVNCPDELDDIQLKDVELGLDHLLDETNGNSRIPFDESLILRKSSARLANRLFHFYNNRKQKNPAAILNWKEAMENNEEFDDIRNQWIS